MVYEAKVFTMLVMTMYLIAWPMAGYLLDKIGRKTIFIVGFI